MDCPLLTTEGECAAEDGLRCCGIDVCACELERIMDEVKATHERASRSD